MKQWKTKETTKEGRNKTKVKVTMIERRKCWKQDQEKEKKRDSKKQIKQNDTQDGREEEQRQRQELKGEKKKVTK